MVQITLVIEGHLAMEEGVISITQIEGKARLIYTIRLIPKIVFKFRFEQVSVMLLFIFVFSSLIRVIRGFGVLGAFNPYRK